jgi:hypothetical protein
MAYVGGPNPNRPLDPSAETAAGQRSVRLTESMDRPLRMGRLGLRIRCVACLAIPVTAVWAASYVAESRPAAGNSASWGWLPLGLSGVALALLIAPVFLQRSLRQSREALKDGIQVEQLLLLVAIGGAAAASMMPAILMSLGDDTGKLVLPWAATCLIWQAFWLWRLRHAL